MTTINNLSKHDSREFKVGDLVVYLSNIAPEHNEIYEVWKVDLTGCLIVLNDMDYRATYHQIRHATPSEIKAGHRIDDTTDHVTDIRNHVSPSTIVKDLEAERHG